jgi:hypothetical protein
VRKYKIDANLHVVNANKYCSVSRRKREETGLMRNRGEAELTDVPASSAHDVVTGVEIKPT